ncbi:hypothetical protein G7Y89_g3181 [Cudoniella acicularis]|uniref:Uncharacterized protein n=1 Tax=Cudoniella acicularis TaxID=354080 RepID=A0A8H4RSR2_9HELO|nr:hypothetical protein G7Y89_g3181 [Cudoniella acicularis]
MDKAKEHALSQYEDEVPVPYEEAPAYEAGTSASAGNALGTTLTIDQTGMSIIEVPLGSAPPYYTLSTSLLHVNSSSSVDISRLESNGGETLAVYSIAEQFISPLHPVRPMFKNVTVARSSGIFAAIGLRKIVWDFCTQVPIPPKNGGKIDGPAGETAGAFLSTLGDDPIGVQKNLLRFFDGKWIGEDDEVLALAREGGAKCEGMPVLSVVKDLDQGMMDFLISAWCVTLWGETEMEDAYVDIPMSNYLLCYRNLDLPNCYAHKLMGSVLEEAPYNSGLVGSFIHPKYFKFVPPKRSESNPAFNAWLQECIGILRHPRLVDTKDPTQLSPVFRYIIKARPEKLLETLKAHWSSYAGVINADLASKISEVEVPNTNIGLAALNKTFISSEKLTARRGEFFSAFHVGIEDDLDFWLQILYYCKLSKGPFRYEIYEVIQWKVWVSSDSEDKLKVCKTPMTDRESSTDLSNSRTSFEEDALIYDMLGKIWTAPSACLWSKDDQVPGKSTISGQYEDLKDLFAGVLKVKIPDLRLLVEELKRVAQSSPSINDVKGLIWQINSFAPTSEDLGKLRGCKIFPVRKADGTSELRTRLARFLIIDRQPWADAFEGKLDFLDFSLKEVKALEPFLLSMELEGYLSGDVIEKSPFQGILPEPSTKRTRHLQRRAHALSRCATHFDSPRTKNDSQTLYQLLFHAKVYETDGIVGCLQHTHLGETNIVKTSKIKLHIEESQERLNLFNETMMAEIDSNSILVVDPSAVSIITAIFASGDEVIDLVLEEAGIAPVPYPDQYEEELQQSRSDDVLSGPQFESEADLETETESLGSGTPMGIPTLGASATSARGASFSVTATSTYRASYQPSSQPQPVRLLSSPPRPSPESVLPDNARHPFTPGSNHAEYRRLLDNVITAATNKRGGFPSQGSFNLGELLDALPVEASRDASSYDLPFGVRNENQLAHDMKVGAAGELYAFEIFSRLETSLPEFGRHDWQSTIRRHVTIHENYRDMKPWRGAETADITYDDTKGELTQLLIANGYLDGSIWAYARLKYFLEVKTTTKEVGLICGFMSIQLEWKRGPEGIWTWRKSSTSPRKRRHIQTTQLKIKIYISNYLDKDVALDEDTDADTDADSASRHGNSNDYEAEDNRALDTFDTGRADASYCTDADGSKELEVNVYHELIDIPQEISKAPLSSSKESQETTRGHNYSLRVQYPTTSITLAATGRNCIRAKRNRSDGARTMPFSNNYQRRDNASIPPRVSKIARLVRSYHYTSAILRGLPTEAEIKDLALLARSRVRQGR